MVFFYFKGKSYLQLLLYQSSLLSCKSLKISLFHFLPHSQNPMFYILVNLSLNSLFVTFLFIFNSIFLFWNLLFIYLFIFSFHPLSQNSLVPILSFSFPLPISICFFLFLSLLISLCIFFFHNPTIFPLVHASRQHLLPSIIFNSL